MFVWIFFFFFIIIVHRSDMPVLLVQVHLCDWKQIPAVSDVMSVAAFQEAPHMISTKQ